jgi:hypothetical protein
VVLAALAAAVVLGSCYPDGPTSVTELDLVTTIHDQDYRFAAQRTYAMPDTITHVEDEDNPGNNVELSREFDAFILQRVAANMSDLGYRRVTVDTAQDSADCAILVSAIGVKNFAVSGGYYPPYWGWWPGWGWGGGWGGWYYPWYPVVTSYETGTLFVDMVVPDSTNTTSEDLIVVWEASINGLLGSGSTTTQQRLRTTIDQAFAQSQYLGAGR